MVTVPFIGLFCLFGKTLSWRIAAAIFAAVILIVTWVAAGVWLAGLP